MLHVISQNCFSFKKTEKLGDADIKEKSAFFAQQKRPNSKEWIPIQHFVYQDLFFRCNFLLVIQVDYYDLNILRGPNNQRNVLEGGIKQFQVSKQLCKLRAQEIYNQSILLQFICFYINNQSILLQFICLYINIVWPWLISFAKWSTN